MLRKVIKFLYKYTTKYRQTESRYLKDAHISFWEYCDTTCVGQRSNGQGDCNVSPLLSKQDYSDVISLGPNISKTFDMVLSLRKEKTLYVVFGDLSFLNNYFVTCVHLILVCIMIYYNHSTFNHTIIVRLIIHHSTWT